MTSTAPTPETRVDHAGFVVPDLEQALAFFTLHCGAEVAFTLGPSGDDAASRIGAKPGAQFALAMLTIGGTKIELLQWWPCLGQAPSVPNVAGASHLALTVPNVAEFLQRMRSVPDARVLSGPLTFDEGPTPGMTNAFVLTPWGLLIEVVSWA